MPLASSPSRKRRSDTAVVTSAANDVAALSAVIKSNGNTAITFPQQRGKPKLKVRIKRYHGVSQWVWGNHDPNEVCGICQSAYEGVAPGGRWPGEDCPVVWGKCSHSFHLQCVVTWLNGPTARGTCPICRQEWALHEAPEAQVGGT